MVINTKEIGSEFWDIPTCNKENKIFPLDTKWFLAGRTALKYIVEDCDIKSISMPQWCCGSMIAPFLEADVDVSFYDTEPDTEKDAIFIMDYFGYTGHSARPHNYSGIVIRDMTHSVFSAKYNDADYYFGSLRKWSGFLTGGFAWGGWKKNNAIPPCDDSYVKLRKTAMSEKEKYISGKTFCKDFLNIYKEAEERLKFCGICSADASDIEAARYFDLETVKNKRRANAKVLISHFDCIFNLGNDDCPLCVPIDTENRDALRKKLIDNKIYCPVHWPGRDIHGRELSLICDQRYTEDDMLRICKVIEDFYG